MPMKAGISAAHTGRVAGVTEEGAPGVTCLVRGLDIMVSHLPPGTSKWNKIEHRLLYFISQNCQAA